MLKLLQPGIEPLGQFDVEDSDIALMKGGEVAVFRALDKATDAYASDVDTSGPELHLKLGDVSADGILYGLVDEGTSPGYGTLFGQVIGVTAGQGTGYGALSTTGVITVGPSTMAGSGKVALWTKPGLYGISVSAWTSSSEFGAGALNDALYCDAEDGTNDGKITTTSAGNGVAVATFLGPVEDRSLVSTTNVAVGETAEVDFAAVYLFGAQHA